MVCRYTFRKWLETFFKGESTTVTTATVDEVVSDLVCPPSLVCCCSALLSSVGLFFDSERISCVAPGFYATRFCSFMAQCCV